MADVIQGPCRTLPGSFHRVPAGTKCDNHPERLAVSRIQGETDSFGAELHDHCSECRDQYAQRVHAPAEANCDICNHPKLDLQKWRDPEEGLAGRLYDACGDCRSRAAAFFREETDEGDLVNSEEQEERDLIASMGYGPSDFRDPRAPRRPERQGLIPQTQGLHRSGFLGTPINSSVADFDDEDPNHGT